jgi:hypothetical protein
MSTVNDGYTEVTVCEACHSRVSKSILRMKSRGEFSPKHDEVVDKYLALLASMVMAVAEAEADRELKEEECQAMKQKHTS